MGAPWRLTKGAEPDAVKAASPVLNGGDEETCGNATRLVPTQPRFQPRLTPGVRLLVKWAAHGFRTTIQDMGIDHGGLHVLMPEQFLYGANIVAGFQ